MNQKILKAICYLFGHRWVVDPDYTPTDKLTILVCDRCGIDGAEFRKVEYGDKPITGSLDPNEEEIDS